LPLTALKADREERAEADNLLSNQCLKKRERLADCFCPLIWLPFIPSFIYMYIFADSTLSVNERGKIRLRPPSGSGQGYFMSKKNTLQPVSDLRIQL